MSIFQICALVLFSLGVMTAACRPGDCSTTVTASKDVSAVDASLLYISQATLAYLQTGNLNSFVSLVSQNGLIVVRRYVDWQQSEKLQSSRHVTKKNAWAYDIDLSGFDNSLVWDEQTVRIDKSDLQKPEFRALFKQSSTQIRDMLYAYPTSPNYSLNLRDHWYGTPLGPAIQGKLASNSYWLVFYTKERGEWRIWRYECVIH